ncbi:MAG: cell division protein FtsA [Candidatus Vogelbacteria bacterium CG10_big_fil_rev_8_21_14_0_10_50_13]|uniref:Cell division protein FtsA n=1 Tax=Candidatus Vogelbacteria bacterium CG10_big_fil_rev_8_21_14_0_10_50_13 TaxID=1975044 RepID=A0A2H0RFP2_9BACT|nr:MAG: cell division protein FtsA [Candidatus Vogelbacteria bacterium CG10_big_fil_rev_8_21_14_0_10_50_13]
MRNIITGLDIGTAAIRVVVADLGRGRESPQVLAMVKKTARGLRSGYVTNPDEAAEAVVEALREAERATNLRIRHAFIGLSGVSLSSRIVEGGVAVTRGDSEINELDMTRAIDAAVASATDLANEEIIHRFPLGYKLDSKKIIGRPEGLKGNKLEVKAVLITYSRQHLKDLTQVLEAAGLKVSEDDFIAAPLAASLVTLTKMQKTAGAVLANIGAQTTSMAVFEDGLPVSIQVFPIGSNNITNDIALGFKVSLEEAEQIKRGEMAAPVGPPNNRGNKKKLEEVIGARLLDIFQSIETHLKKISRSGLLPAGVVLLGGGASVNGIEELAKDYFKLPARTADAGIATASNNKIKDATWATAYGLTYFGLDLPPEERPGIKIASSFLKYLRELLP